MAKLLKCARSVVGISILVVRGASAQTAAEVEYSAPGTDYTAPRVLHYNSTAQNGPERETAASVEQSSGSAKSAAESGFLSPYALPARIVAGGAWARATGGYDVASRSYRAQSSAESALTSFMALRVDYEHGPSTSTTDRVSLATRFQLFNQTNHGLDFGLALAYQPNNFRGEGTIIGGLVAGRRFGRVAFFGNVLVGTDPEGDDQEVDGRLGTLVRVKNVLQLGWDNRFRAVVTNDGKRYGKDSVDWELSLLPNAVVTFGHVAILGEAGFCALQQTESTGQPEQRRSVRTGLIAMAGAAAAF